MVFGQNISSGLLKIAALLLILAWGGIKILWEKRLISEIKIFSGTSFSIKINEQIGQDTLLAVLSGFRSIVADWYWLKINHYFEERKWSEVRRTIEFVCWLQPKYSDFWELGAWHLAWNIGHAVRYNPQESSLARRIKDQNYYIKAGRLLLDRGLHYLPNHFELWAARGFLRSEKQKDYAGAAEDYFKASSFSDAPLYVYRQVAYNLERAGKEKEAYAFWIKVWKKFPDKALTPEMRWDRVKIHIQRLEEKLQLPQSQRFFQ